MYKVTSDYAQTHFSEILDRVSQDSEGVMIIQENKSFVLIAQDELEALIEATELLKDPTLLADFTFQPQQHQILGLVYYTPSWVAAPGVNYTTRD